jgi:hypothetical protein
MAENFFTGELAHKLFRAVKFVGRVMRFLKL